MKYRQNNIFRLIKPNPRFWNNKVTREVNFHQGSLNAVSVSKSNSMLFLAAQNGVLLTVALPLMYQVVRKEYKMFNQSITKVTFTKRRLAYFHA